MAPYDMAGVCSPQDAHLGCEDLVLPVLLLDDFECINLPRVLVSDFINFATAAMAEEAELDGISGVDVVFM